LKLQNKEKSNGTYQPKNKSDGDGKSSVVCSDADALVVFVVCVSRDSEWILDTAASCNICCNKDWFCSYEFVHPEDFVRMGDDTPCQIEGTDSVYIKTHDGMTRTLTGVNHTYQPWREILILLITLDSEGYKYRGGNKVLKVSRGSLIHMNCDINSAKLYVLRGSTLPGIVVVVTSDEPSKTNFWHACLGHMSKHGMAELIKRVFLVGWNE
jgi:hypothetical protein